MIFKSSWFFAQICFGFIDRLRNATRKIVVIVFEHDHIIKRKPVIFPAANFDCPLLRSTESGCGFFGYLAL